MNSKKEVQHVYLVGAKSLGAYGGYETFVYKLTEYHQNEPTGSLDKKNRDIVMRLLHELNEEGKTVIIVTHDQGIIEDEPYVVKI